MRLHPGERDDADVGVDESGVDPDRPGDVVLVDDVAGHEVGIGVEIDDLDPVLLLQGRIAVVAEAVAGVQDSRLGDDDGLAAAGPEELQDGARRVDVGDGQGVLVDGHVRLDENALLAVDGGPDVILDELEGLKDDLAPVLPPDETEPGGRFDGRRLGRGRERLSGGDGIGIRIARSSPPGPEGRADEARSEKPAPRRPEEVPAAIHACLLTCGTRRRAKASVRRPD